jgi:hypothetical protein
MNVFVDIVDLISQTSDQGWRWHLLCQTLPTGLEHLKFHAFVQFSLLRLPQQRKGRRQFRH